MTTLSRPALALLAALPLLTACADTGTFRAMLPHAAPHKAPAPPQDDTINPQWAKGNARLVRGEKLLAEGQAQNDSAKIEEARRLIREGGLMMQKSEDGYIAPAQ